MEGIFNRKHTLTDAVEAAVDAVDPEDDDAAVDAAVEAAVDADGSSIWQMIAVSKIAKQIIVFRTKVLIQDIKYENRFNKDTRPLIIKMISIL